MAGLAIYTRAPIQLVVIGELIDCAGGAQAGMPQGIEIGSTHAFGIDLAT